MTPFTPPTLAASISADRPDCLYRLGETATFTVSVAFPDGQPAKGTLVATLDNSGYVTFDKQSLNLTKATSFQVSGTLDEPGFLRLSVATPDAPDVRLATWGVAFEPERIEAVAPDPADFDAFWADAKRRLDETTPVDPQMIRVPDRCTDAFDFYRVSFASHRGRVWGWLSIPKDASPERRYPVRFEIPGAGTGPWAHTMEGYADSIHMKMTVHADPLPFDNGEFLAYYDGLRARLKAAYGVEGYSIAGLGKSREDYYYYRAILGICRAADWLAERPEVDASRFTYEGGSQGGGLGLAVLGLSRRFTKGLLLVPALSDVLGFQRGRRTGCAPCPVRDQPEEDRARATAFAPYFEGANFAARIRCPVRVLVGFADNAVAPTAVYAVYNRMTVPDRAIVNGIGMGHGCTPAYTDPLHAWLRIG